MIIAQTCLVAESLASPEFLDLPRILGICSKCPEYCPEILDKFEKLFGEEYIFLEAQPLKKRPCLSVRLSVPILIVKIVRVNP